MKEIGIVTTKISLVFANGTNCEYEYTEAFANANEAWRYAKTAEAYKEAYNAAIDSLDVGQAIKWYFPIDSKFKRLVLQSKA